MDFDKLLENKYIYGGLIIFIVIYLQTVKLNINNTTISRVLNSNLFRLIVLALIAYISTKDIVISLLLSIGFVSLLIILKNNNTIENNQ